MVILLRKSQSTSIDIQIPDRKRAADFKFRSKIDRGGEIVDTQKAAADEWGEAVWFVGRIGV